MLGQMKPTNISAMGCFLNIMSQSTFIFALLIIQLFRIKAKFEPSVAMNMHMNHIPTQGIVLVGTNTLKL